LGVGRGLSGLALLGAYALFGRLSARNYRRLPELTGVPHRDAGRVSIVIPARDEADRLPGLLRSLRNLTYPDFDVLVVDDGSRDATAEVARAEGVRVLQLDGPEPGWTGKSFACGAGAGATGGEWLLFTDADTVHGGQSLGLALDTALKEGAGLVSLLARQRCQTFWERLLLPYAYFLYFAGVGAVNCPGGTPVANGQYMLFRRPDYQRLGGHAAVRGSLVEDVSLAQLANRKGVRVVLARGEDHLEVRMYSSLPALWEGFGKNAFRFLTVSPRHGALTAAASTALSMAAPAAWRARSLSLRLGLLAAPALALAGWERRFGVPWTFAVLHPLAAVVFQLIALDSLRRTLMRRGTVWKGRRY
jgi:hypothetical protein